MKRLLILLSCFYLVIAFVGSNAEIIEVPDVDAWNPMVIGGGVSAGGSNCGSTGEFDENFDDTGYCNSWTEDAAGSPVNVIDEDSTTNKTGTYSLLLDINDSDADSYTYSTGITPQGDSNPMYYSFEMWVPDGFGTTWAGISTFYLHASGVTEPDHNTAIFRVYVMDADGSDLSINAKVMNGSQLGSTGYTFGQKYTIRVMVGADLATDGISWCIDTTIMDSSVTGTDSDEAVVFFGAASGNISTTHTGISIDSFIQSTVASETGWNLCS